MLNSNLRVNSELELKHFITYIGLDYRKNTLTLLDRNGEFHVADIDGELFEIHEDLLHLIAIKCGDLQINNRVLQ